MKDPFDRTSPIAQFIRWLLAAVANFAHADHGFLVFYQTPVPKGVAGDFVIRTWGDLVDLLHLLLPSGAWQLTLAIVTHSITAIMVIWWAIESRHAYLEAKSWTANSIVRWKHTPIGRAWIRLVEALKRKS